MENFVSIALLLIVKVAERPHVLPVRLPFTPPEELQTSIQPLAAEAAQQ
jgi:hypothetical protein